MSLAKFGKDQGFHEIITSKVNKKTIQKMLSLFFRANKLHYLVS
jgi:hypothetical protein